MIPRTDESTKITESQFEKAIDTKYNFDSEIYRAGAQSTIISRTAKNSEIEVDSSGNIVIENYQYKDLAGTGLWNIKFSLILSNEKS